MGFSLALAVDRKKNTLNLEGENLLVSRIRVINRVRGKIVAKEGFFYSSLYSTSIKQIHHVHEVI